MNVRLKFKKEGPIRFVGHLDLMRTFQKMFMRCGIPVAYSEGFNPHQIFSFAAALAVGVSSEGEYLDLKLSKEVPVEVLIPVINGHTPAGITIVDGVELPDKEPKAMAALVAAKYVITMNAMIITQEMIGGLLGQDEILIEKKTKKGKMKTLDLKPGIFEMNVLDNTIEMVIATGSQFNIKPEMILQYLLTSMDQPFIRGDFFFHRVEMYQEHEGLIPLLSVTKQ